VHIENGHFIADGHHIYAVQMATRVHIADVIAQSHDGYRYFKWSLHTGIANILYLEVENSP
jgi:hypothetical protein